MIRNLKQRQMLELLPAFVTELFLGSTFAWGCGARWIHVIDIKSALIHTTLGTLAFTFMFTLTLYSMYHTAPKSLFQQFLFLKFS